MNGRKAKLIRKVHGLLKSPEKAVKREKAAYQAKSAKRRQKASAKLRLHTKNLKEALTSRYEAGARKSK